MNANELRIGNMVSLIDRRGEVHIPNGLTYKLYSINIFTCVICDARLNFAECQQSDFFDVDIADLSPIPLTEEILLKCGFEKDYEGHFLLAFNGRLYYYDLENGFLLKDFKVKTKLNQFPFYNLHQLQNLIFILTNTEPYDTTISTERSR